MVCKVRLASPLDCGYFGLLVMCSMFPSLEILTNSAEMYCAPLSDRTMSGTLCPPKIEFGSLGHS